MKYIALAASAAAALLASPAAAQVASTISATTTPTSASADFAQFLNFSPNCSTYATGYSRFYEVRTVTVATTGSYSITESGSVIDGELGLYSGTFDTASPSTNCVMGIDDLRTATIPAGTYIAVFTSHSGGGSAGVVGYSFNGPGAVTVSAAPSPAAVPTLSEWAMILFGTIMAGGAALYIQRRRFTA